ncbi:MAG: 3-hydroxyisobutyrate dehydrogenase [Rhodobacteraceae bacterium]|nr:3-hydroxyisobutyrate dehydrogenase [Paracoccaceae bacterium]
MKIGFVGLGNMGNPMAQNLCRAGHEVAGFDIAAVCPDGVTDAGSSAAAARHGQIVITMLPDGNSLRNAVSEIMPEMSAGNVLLDCSTVDIASAKAAADEASAAFVHFVDAPVSGGVSGAEAGTLTFMAGGTQEAFDLVLPLLKIMGGRVVHCGSAGSGQAAKICNNMILGATMIVTCEAFGLADRLGLSRDKMFEVVSTSSGFSWSLNKYCPAPNVGPNSPSDNDYMPGFASDLMLKDLRLSQEAATSCDADTPIGRHAMEIFRTFVEEENGSGLDFSAIIKKFETP